MAGHVVAIYLRENGYAVDTLSSKHPLDKNTHLIDVTDSANFREFLDSHLYDVVVNCIGLLVKESEQRKDLAAYLNAYLPHFLENYYKESKTRVIHLSTDCVFSSNNSPHKENSAYDAEGFYDRSKALGEIINAKDLTFRMSIIGPDMRADGSGLFNWFYQQKGEVTGYDKVFWSGITTTELARGIREAIEQNIGGVYHLVPKKNISKYNLLQLFQEIFDLKFVNVKPKSDIAQDRTLINTRRDFDFAVPDYRKMVTEMKDWITHHPQLYKHYESR